MLAVATREDVDYRFIFREGVWEMFERKIGLIYFACSTENGAPFLDDIVDELWQVMVEVYLADLKVSNPEEHQKFQHISDYLENSGDIRLGMDEAREFIFQNADKYFLDMFHRDLLLYLFQNQMSFFLREGPYEERQGKQLYNSAIVGVW